MRSDFIRFARPDISEEAISDVVDSLRSGWITTGPKTALFEKVFCEYTGSPFSMAVNSATAGLHLALLAFGIGPGDEVITTPMTFAATVNTIVWVGASPILADIEAETLNIDPARVESAVTPRTKAVIPVHFAGRPCNMDAIEDIARRHGLVIIEDAAHALGAEYRGRRIGTPLGERHAAVFSFHPTKNITTGEGGMVCTGCAEAAEKISVLRQHGMSKGAWNRYAVTGNPHYDILFPGLKYNMLDIQAAIGTDQMKHLEDFNRRRSQIADIYLRELDGIEALSLPAPMPPEDTHSWHIFTPLVETGKPGMTRDDFMARMRERNIGTALHYQAIHLFSYFAETFGWKREDFPNAAHVSDRIVSLPLFPAMTDGDIEDTIEAVREICS